MADIARPVGRPRTAPVPEGYYSPDTVAARRAYMAAYKAANSENLKAYYTAWRAANPDKHRQYSREWAARDRERRAQAANQGELVAPPELPPDAPPAVEPQF